MSSSFDLSKLGGPSSVGHSAPPPTKENKNLIDFLKNEHDLSFHTGYPKISLPNDNGTKLSYVVEKVQAQLGDEQNGPIEITKKDGFSYVKIKWHIKLKLESKLDEGEGDQEKEITLDDNHKIDWVGEKGQEAPWQLMAYISTMKMPFISDDRNWRREEVIKSLAAKVLVFDASPDRLTYKLKCEVAKIPQIYSTNLKVVEAANGAIDIQKKLAPPMVGTKTVTVSQYIDTLSYKIMHQRVGYDPDKAKCLSIIQDAPRNLAEINAKITEKGVAEADLYASLIEEIEKDQLKQSHYKSFFSDNAKERGAWTKNSTIIRSVKEWNTAKGLLAKAGTALAFVTVIPFALGTVLNYDFSYNPLEDRKFIGGSFTGDLKRLQQDRSEPISDAESNYQHYVEMIKSEIQSLDNLYKQEENKRNQIHELKNVDQDVREKELREIHIRRDENMEEIYNKINDLEDYLDSADRTAILSLCQPIAPKVFSIGNPQLDPVKQEQILARMAAGRLRAGAISNASGSFSPPDPAILGIGSARAPQGKSIPIPNPSPGSPKSASSPPITPTLASGSPKPVEEYDDSDVEGLINKLNSVVDKDEFDKKLQNDFLGILNYIVDKPEDDQIRHDLVGFLGAWDTKLNIVHFDKQDQLEVLQDINQKIIDRLNRGPKDKDEQYLIGLTQRVFQTYLALPSISAAVASPSLYNKNDIQRLFDALKDLEDAKDFSEIQNEFIEVLRTIVNFEDIDEMHESLEDFLDAWEDKSDFIRFDETDSQKEQLKEIYENIQIRLRNDPDPYYDDVIIKSSKLLLGKYAGIDSSAPPKSQSPPSPLPLKSSSLSSTSSLAPRGSLSAPSTPIPSPSSKGPSMAASSLKAASIGSVVLSPSISDAPTLSSIEAGGSLSAPPLAPEAPSIAESLFVPDAPSPPEPPPERPLLSQKKTTHISASVASAAPKKESNISKGEPSLEDALKKSLAEYRRFVQDEDDSNKDKEDEEDWGD